MTVSIDKLRSGLNTIPKEFSRILAPDARKILEEVETELVRKKKEYDEKKRRRTLSDDDWWGYIIFKEKPLRFVDSAENRGGKLSVDLYCKIKWKEVDQPPFSQNICLRIWSSEPGLIFREQWDSNRILEQLSDPSRTKAERVMHRMHFDKAEAGQQGPTYHLQFGGNQPLEERELCWFPEAIKLPRLIHAPMDLLLACQLIAANFYSEVYASVRNKPYWKNLVRYSQEYLLKDYYRKCLTSIENGDSLLDDTLWNSINNTS